MHLQFLPADGFNHVQARHVGETDIGNRQAELAAQRFLNSVSSGGSERHAITVVLKNHLESIGNAPLILNDEDFVLLFVATFRHDFRLAIVMPSIKIYNGHKKAHKAHKIILCFLCLLWLDWSGS